MVGLLDHKTAVITGGAGNIGRAISSRLASEGAGIVLIDLNAEALSDAADRLRREYGVRAVCYVHDLRSIAEHDAFASRVEEECGPVDILVNNAGVDNTVSLWDMTEKAWDFVMDINLKGTLFFARPFLRRMIDRGSGRMINLGSISGERGAQFSGPHYSVSKAGIIMMTKVFAKLAAGSGVTVNTVSPGLIESEMGRSLGLKVSPADVPMNRFGTVEEVADAVLFLASPLSSYLTGQNIGVNGGQSMR